MISLIVFSIIMLFSVFLAILSRRGIVSNNMNDIMVANRSFGSFLIFFVSVGEIYSIGTMIGVPGSIFSKGSSYAIWFLGYILLGYPVGYFLNPALWRAGKAANAVTTADLFGWRFNSKGLEVIVALVGVFFLLPWGQLQFAGLGVIFKYLGTNISFSAGVILAAIIAFLYILIAGIKAPAWVSIMKDILMIFAILIGGIVAATNMPGGIHGIFQTAMQKFPNHLTIAVNPWTKNLSFVISTILFQSLGFYMFPFSMQYVFSGKSEHIIRRNQIIMPLYMLMYPFLIVTSFFALVSLGKLKLPDEAFMAIVSHYVPSWLLGVVAAGGALTAILVLSVISLAVGGLVSKNLISVFAPKATNKQAVRWTNIVTALSLVFGILLTLFWPTLMLNVINMAYFGISQFFPGVVALLLWKRATKWGIGAGLLSGVVSVMVLYFGKIAPYGLNQGIIAICINAVVLIAVSYLTKPDKEAEMRLEKYKNGIIA